MKVMKRLGQGIRYIFTGHYTFTEKNREESVQVRALKKQIETMQDLQDNYISQIKVLMKQTNDTNMWGVISRVAEGLFSNNNASSSVTKPPMNKKIVNITVDKQRLLDLIHHQIDNSPVEELREKYAKKDEMISKIFSLGQKYGFTDDEMKQQIPIFEEKIKARLQENGQ